MKPYFVKYLPVEGEIKEGDILKHQSFEYVKFIGTLENGLYACFTNDSISVTTVNPDAYKKVKLFLCSRDIKVGDIVDEIGRTNPLNPPIKVEELFEEGTVDTNWGHFNGPGLYKVIGEISPEATWVKEGDEFDKDEIEFLLVYEQDYEQDTILIVKEEEYIKAEIGDEYESRFTTLYEKRITVKGPCGHYH